MNKITKSRNFNYEDTFMGVMEGKPSTYKRTFQDDYRIKRLVEMLKIKDGKLLDIGCGGGITTESLQYYYPKVKLYGCDISKKAIDYAKEFGSGKVTYDVNTEKLPYKNNTFDVCVCFDVMEHIPDAKFFVEEVRRVLKKDGKFFLLVPCEGQPLTHTWVWQKIGIGNNMTFKRYGHIHPEFTHKYVEKLLTDNGFLIKKRAYSEHLLFQLISLIVYFIPLEIMDLVLGKQSRKYKDSGVIKSMTTKKKENFDPMILVRNTWLGFTRFMRNITLWELDSFKNNSLTAWKLIVVAQNNKKNEK